MNVMATVVILTKVPGAAPVKTRLHKALGADGAERLFLDMLAATAALARRFDVEPIVAYSPPGAALDALRRALGRCRYMPLAASGGAACLEEALTRAYAGVPLVALGGDAPDLPAALLDEAIAAVHEHDLALVPTPDGGFSCLTLARPVQDLATAFEFGGGDACAKLIAFARARGLSVALLSPWPDVDTPEDLEGLVARGWRPTRRRTAGSLPREL